MDPGLGRFIDINLTPEEDRPAAAPVALPYVVFWLLVGLLLLAFIPVTLFWRSVDGSAAGLAARKTAAETRLGGRTPVAPDVAALQGELATMQAAVRSLDDDLTSMALSRGPWGNAVRGIYGSVGASVALTSVKATGRKVTIQGNAETLNDITAYADRLRKNEAFTSVTIESATGLVATPPSAPPAPGAAPPAGAPLPAATAPTAATPPPAQPVGGAPPPAATPVPGFPPPAPTAVAGSPPPPAPTTAPLPTYTPYPTYTPAPTLTPYPTLAATQTPVPRLQARLRDVQISPLFLFGGAILRVDATIDNLGDIPLTTQDDPPPGFTYNEGEAAPVANSGVWRFALDTLPRAANQTQRYRWGLGGALPPGSSRRVTGYVRLSTPGVYTYCAGLVQEWVQWWGACQGQTTITVAAPTAAVPTATATGVPFLSPTPTATFFVPPLPTATRTATPTFLALPSPTTPAVACADGYEVDDAYSQARVIGANSSLPQQHNLHKLGDNDWLKFAVSPGMTYTLRTQDLRNGADTGITIYGLSAGTLSELYANDEDPANLIAFPPLAGPSRIDYSFTPTQTAQFGTTFYAKVYSPNPFIFGCDKSYEIRLQTGVALAPGGLEWAALVTDQVAVPEAAPAEARLDFSIVVEVRGGVP